jgi:hypothetical protein
MPPNAVEIRFLDDSVLKARLADERLEIATPHGRLRIPSSDILRIDFAQRLPPDTIRAIEQSLAELADANPEIQKQAADRLIGLGEQAYPELGKAAKAADSPRALAAAKVLARLRKIISPKLLAAIRDEDFIETVEGKITGRIVAPSIAIETSQFGRLAMKLSDVRNLRHASLAREPMEEELAALPDPGNLKGYETQFDKVLTFTVTGADSGGNLWGTDVYTTDSRLAMAAVHAGVLQVGETGAVRVKIIASPNAFAGSTQRGIVSSNYGRYTAAYQVLKPDDEP